MVEAMAVRAHTAGQSINGGVTYKWIAGILIIGLAGAYGIAGEIASNRTRIAGCETQMIRMAGQIDDIHRLLFDRLSHGELYGETD